MLDGNLIAILHECRCSRNPHHAKRLHAFMRQQRLDAHPALGNHLVPMLVDCGCLPDALQAFRKIDARSRSEHSWTSLISGHSASHDPRLAFVLFDQMHLDNYAQPSRYTYIALLNACARLEDAELGRMIHAESAKRGLDTELYVGSSLVDLYGKCGLLADAHLVFDCLRSRDAVSWNALISGHSEHGLGEEVLNCFEVMQLKSMFTADPVTFVCCLKSCGTTGHVEAGYEIHTEVTKRGFETQLYVGSALVNMYGKCGFLQEGIKVFDLLPVKNSEVWTALVAGYAERGLSKEVLNCSMQMKLEGVSFDVVTMVCSLKACSCLENLEVGQEFHSELIKRGFERDNYVGSTLISMYGKFSLVEDAYRVSQMLSLQNVVAWNALIATFAQNGHDKEALNSFQLMQREGVLVDAVTFVCILKVCGTIQALEKGQEVHAEITSLGLDNQLLMGNVMIDMYAKCGALPEGQELFNQLPVRDAVSWNALIAGYTENGLSEDAGNAFRGMQCDGICPDCVALVCSLTSCGKTGALDAGWDVHCELVKRGFEREIHVGTALVDMYGKCGSVKEGYQVFCSLYVQDAVSWNALIAGYARQGLTMEVLNSFELMQEQGVPMDSSTIVCILKSSGILGSLKVAHAIHACILKIGLEQGGHVASAMVSMYGKCGSFVDVCHMFDRLAIQDVTSWNVLVAGYAEHGLSQEVWNSFEQMLVQGVPVDDFTLDCSLKLCSALRAVERGQKTHADITKLGMEREVDLGSSLVNMYAKCSLFAEAHQVLDRLLVRTSISWNALLGEYVEHGLGEEALQCFKEMQVSGDCADAATFILCIKACIVLGGLETGQEIHSEICKCGLERDLSLGNMLVDMYGKCSSLAEGQEIFERLPLRDVVSWNTMIKAYGENHEGNAAVHCFEEMQTQGVKPSSITFTCLLAACSHANLVREGQKYFIVMRKHKIQPAVDHCSCMVDLFARSGYFDEAERFIAEMQCPPSSAILLALLSACKSFGKAELGEKCFHHLVEMNQEDAAAYLLLADSYAGAGRWSDAHRLEEVRICAGANKKPASVLLEINKSVHEFTVGDKQSQYISEISDTLSSRMKGEGYVPGLYLILGMVSVKEYENGF